MQNQPAANRPRFFAAVRQNFACIVASFVLVGITTIWFIGSYHGPEVVTLDAPANQFSAERAINELKMILGDRSAHEAGSQANFEVRDRLIERIQFLGLEVQQTPFEFNGVKMCNLLTSIPGQQNTRPILLATHYDSVEQGPGAGDAGSCVAALLETARILQDECKLSDGQQLSREVFFLFTDGEEWVRKIGHGLNGAIQFVETDPHPMLARNPIILNFDARGAAGPSLLYETSGQNLKLIQHATAALPRPAFTASSYVTVYDLLPNATDFTIFKQAGLDGLNFAFIDDPHRYHTSDDTLASLDPRCMQHHGENALALIHHLLQTDEKDFQSKQNAVFFTVFNQSIICYPEKWAVGLAAAMLLLQLGGTWFCLRRGATIAEIFKTVVLVVLSLMLSMFAGWIVMQLDRYRVQSYHGFGPYDPWIVGLLWICSVAAAVILFSWLGRKISNESSWAAIWLGTAVVGLLVSVYLPGFSYLLLGLGLCPALLSFLPQDKAKLSVIAIAAAGVFSVPLAYQFGIALGPKMAMVLSALFVLFLCPMVPLLTLQKTKDVPEGQGT